MTDDSIVELIFKKDERGLSELQKKHGRLISRICEGILRSKEDAEECGNDTLKAVWDAIPPDRPQNLAGYVVQLARRIAVSRVRYNTAAARNVDLLTELDECAPSKYSVEEAAALSELTAALNAWLGTLPEKQRTLFVRRYYLLLSVKESARGCKMSETAASTALMRLRASLKNYLKERECMMSELNPIISALDGIDENYALKAVTVKRKNKPLKIAVIAAAAALALGGTAAAATLGDDPPIKINDKTVTFKSDTYVDQNGYTVRTRAVEVPTGIAGYEPVGVVRAVHDKDWNDEVYDELGVNIHEISVGNYYIFIDGEKEGEIPFSATMFGSSELHHVAINRTPDGEYNIEIWQDPIQVVKQQSEENRVRNMSVEEKMNLYLEYGFDFGYPDFGGLEHPSMRVLVENDARGHSGEADVQIFDSLPSEIMKLYGYAPVSAEGLTEKAGLTVVMYKSGEYNSDAGKWEYPDGKKIIQQMFVYTLTDEDSGMDVKLTVWRSAENKDTYTDHFGFDYEYITLNDGTTARLHRSENGESIAEYEHGGAAYALVTRLDRDGIERVMQRLGLI